VKSKSLACLALLSSVIAVVAQTSSFTYQGRFSSNGVPVTGELDFRFSLHATSNQTNQLGNAVTNAPLAVTNGLFTTTLDFGSSVFDGSARWLQIGVRPLGDTNEYTALAPRQLITATPYAVRAANFSGPVAAANLTGTIPDARLSTNVALLNTNVTFAGNVTAVQFNGSGAGLSSVPAASLTGTIADPRLSTNVAFLNTSNAVFKGAITATNFYGYGGGLSNVPGRIFEYIATANNLTATANFGYLATNNATAVVVTLPATANIRVGETVRVTGGGAGGWIVAQNAGQVILVGNLVDTVGFAWRTNESSRAWKAVASSSDGSKLVAVVNGGNIYTSTNYGVNWTVRATVFGNLAWSSVASSADGTKLVASVNPGFIYTSIDSGANWTQRTASGSRNWTSVASSFDGTKLIACAGNSGTYVSTDSGASWPAGLTGLLTWSGVASSGNGSNVVSVAQGSQIYTSTNSGVSGSWFPRASNGGWSCVASSADGSRLVAGQNTGFLYVSPDFGASWIPNGISASWTGVGCSDDGSRMIAVASNGGVYVSLDSGATWQQRANLPSSSTLYSGAASSGDGSTMVAVVNSQPIYVSSQATTTVGTAGQLAGSRLAAVELQHIGNGVFVPLSYVGTIRAK
jgi:hypothetical protein